MSETEFNVNPKKTMVISHAVEMFMTMFKK